MTAADLSWISDVRTAKLTRELAALIQVNVLEIARTADRDEVQRLACQVAAHQMVLNMIREIGQQDVSESSDEANGRMDERTI